MSGEIDALYIYDENNSPLVEHVYRSRPPSAASTLPLYFAHPPPRPSLLYIPNSSPPVTVFSILHENLLFLALSEVDSEPLLVLEFLHRVVDALEVFIGGPLLSSKIQVHYDVVAQLLNEMCDAGVVCNTELNALQEVVEVPGWMGKLLGGLAGGSSTPILRHPSPLKQSLSSAGVAQGPAIPWRKSNVRHTSNELYVDIIESLSVTIAPSGRVLSALVSGTIAFTAEISGVPELVLNLTTPAGQQGIAQRVQLPVFHPCVRLARWRERPGELSFIPPDGGFILAGYEVDLLPIDPDLNKPPSHMEKIFLPAIVDIRKSLGTTGSEFEVRLTLNTDFPGFPSPGSRSGAAGRGGPGTSTPSFLGGSGANAPSSPILEEVVVTVPISKSVRNIVGMQASRGDAQYSPGSDVLKWYVPTKDAGSVSGTATLRCTVAGHQPSSEDVNDDDISGDAEANHNLLQGYYDDSASTSYQNNPDNPTATTTTSNSTMSPSTRRTKSTSKRKTTKKKKSKKSSSRPTSSIIQEEEENNNPQQQPFSSIVSLPQMPSLTSSSSPPPPSSSTQPPPPPPLAQQHQHQQHQQEPSIFRPPPRKTKTQLNATLMPNSASVSFSVRGWLPSGIRVDSLNIDPRRSRGLGEGVRPYKGVKYLCVSRKGVERRC